MENQQGDRCPTEQQHLLQRSWVKILSHCLRRGSWVPPALHTLPALPRASALGCSPSNPAAKMAPWHCKVTKSHLQRQCHKYNSANSSFGMSLWLTSLWFYVPFIRGTWKEQNIPSVTQETITKSSQWLLPQQWPCPASEHLWAHQWPQPADALPCSASCADTSLVCKAVPDTGENAAPFAALISKNAMKRARRQLVVDPRFWQWLTFLFRKEKKVHIFPSLTGLSKQFSIHTFSWCAVGSSCYKVSGHMILKPNLHCMVNGKSKSFFWWLHH